MKDKNLVIEKIRAQYTESVPTDLDNLKALDARVKRPAKIFGFTYGTLSALIMGSGMSLVMTDLGDILGIEASIPVGFALGVVGLAMALTTWSIYKMILESRRKEYADQILELADRIAAEEGNADV
jgi:hypothetical protein